MKTYENNILIPISQSLNTQKAVAEAIRRAKPWQTTIHLVCLMRSWNPFIMIHPSSAFERMLNDDLDSYLQALFNLMHWKDLIEKNCCGITVRIHLRKGFSWQSLMQQTTQKVGPGMIILAYGPKRHWFSIRKFNSLRLWGLQTGCKILSIKSDIASGITENTLSTVLTNKIPSPGNKAIGAFYLQFF